MSRRPPLNAKGLISRLRQGVAVAALIAVSGTAGQAETIREALAGAYVNNPTLNSARATLRGVDENLPQALAGWRPTASFTGTNTRTRTNTEFSETFRTNSVISVSISQALFRGFRTINSTRQADAVVMAQRESLMSTEQDVLLSAATSYVDVIRDTALVSLQRSDLAFLQEQVRAARDRFDVGEGTRTDVSQAEARAAEARASLNTALANLNTSRAIYRQVIGVEPENLSADTSIVRYVPQSIDEALDQSDTYQPLIRQASHLVDAAIFNVKAIEGELLPTVTVDGSLQRSWTPASFTLNRTDVTDEAQVSITGSIPLYQGGAVYSRVRQAKEELGQTRLQLDIARDQVRANVISAWGNYYAAEASIQAAQAAVQASRLALEGVIEEQRVGQRTTLDVLDAQRELVTQQANLVIAQRNRIVGGYQLVASTGQLDAGSLGLDVAIYRPQDHYQDIRGKWIGLRTPDGR